MRTLARLRSNVGAFNRYVHASDRPMVVTQLIFIPVVLVPLFVDAGPTAARVMDAANTTFWALFLTDYLVRLYLVPTPRHYVATHLLDLLLIVLFMLPIFTVPRGGLFIRTTIALRVVPLFLSATQRMVVLIYRRLGRVPRHQSMADSRDPSDEQPPHQQPEGPSRAPTG